MSATYNTYLNWLFKVKSISDYIETICSALLRQAPNIDMFICFLDINLMELLRSVNAFLFCKSVYVNS